MKKKSLVIFFIFLSFNYLTFSQDKALSALFIPVELKTNANAVIRDYSLEVTIQDIDEMIVRKKSVITILNQAGDRFANIYEGYDNDTKIVSLSATIYDVLGIEQQKYSKKKFTDVSAVDGGTLYSDSRVKYLDYTPISYPYTIAVESEYRTSSTGFIPGWFPISNYAIAVEKSEYKLLNPNKVQLRTKENSFTGFDIENTSDEFNLNYSLKNQKALKYENASISYRELIPYLMVAANDFALKGTLGKASNWKEFGLWMNEKLLKGRDGVSEETRSKIKQLVAGVEDPIERAKIVYEFMQNKTRYISVQVGIGGWQPIPASEVDRVGYGDCKGLSNYTKALLDIAGVESYYTIVYAGRKRSLDKDFASIQGNHIILNIPNNGNDIWLECTSQTMPFGFLGDFTDDRDVLVVTPEGGVIKHTPSYKDEYNLQTTTANIQLLEDGDVKADVLRTSFGTQYDDKFNIERLDKDELHKRYKTRDWNYINNLEVISAKLENNKDSVKFSEKLQLEIKNYASVNEQEYLFRVNVFNRNTYVPKRYRNRKLPLKVSRGYKDVDEFVIEIPKGYHISFLPENREVNTKFGSYILSIEQLSSSKFIYRKSVLIKEGVYPKEDYALYRKFRKNIAKLDNIRISVTKKT